MMMGNGYEYTRNGGKMKGFGTFTGNEMGI